MQLLLFGINSASNAGRETVIVQGIAERYYSFLPALRVLLRNSKYYTVTHTVTN